MTSCRKIKGQQHRPQDSSSQYEFLYVADQDTVQQPDYEELPADSSKDTAATTDGIYASVLNPPEEPEQQHSLPTTPPPVEDAYAYPDFREQSDQPQRHNSLATPKAVKCTYSYVLPPKNSQPEQPQRRATIDAPTTDTKDYSFVLPPEDSPEPELQQQQTSMVALLESANGPNHLAEQHIYQNIPAEHSPESPLVATDHVYATVIVQNKRKPRSAEITPETPLRELLEPTQPATVQSAASTPSNGEMTLQTIISA